MPHDGLIHVAGVIDAEEAELLIDCGVAHLGFPLVLGHHEEDLGVSDAAAIVDRFGGQATFFLITYLNEADAVCDMCDTLGVAMVQLHGDIDEQEIFRLRGAAPELRIIKSLIVRHDNADQLIKEALTFSPHVDAFITDTFDPSTGATGATGKTHDWEVSRALVEHAPKPVILAGGLRPDIVRQAIGAVQPAGVDVHTGVEGADGRKRRDLVQSFVRNAKAGFMDRAASG